MYVMNTSNGRLLNEIGGRHSGVKQGAGTHTAYQHDANTLAGDQISVFDNGSVPKVHPQSRGLVLSLNPSTDSVTLDTQYEHQPALSSDSQGNIQQLANQDMFVGWGSEPYFSEYSASGQLLFDAHLHGSYESYRGYRFEWTGSPATAPSAAATAATGGRVTVYASWNGDTRTAAWRVLAGASPQTLAAGRERATERLRDRDHDPRRRPLRRRSGARRLWRGARQLEHDPRLASAPAGAQRGWYALLVWRQGGVFNRWTSGDDDA